MNQLEAIGRALQFEREKRHLTKTEAARRAGITRADIARIEAGHGGVTWTKVCAYMGLLEVPLPTVNISTLP